MDWKTWGKGYRTLAFGVALALVGALEYVQGQDVPAGTLIVVGALVAGLRAITDGPIFGGKP